MSCSGQYPPPYQYPAPRPPSTSTTGPKALTFIGIAVLVLAIGGGVGAVVLGGVGARTIESAAEKIDSEVDAAALVTVLPGQTETVVLDASTSYTLWLGSDAGVGTPSGASRPVVTDPTGATVPVSTNTYGSAEWDVDDMIAGWRFTSRGAGAYQITTDADGPVLQLVPGVELEALIDAATGVFQILGAVTLGVVAFGLGPIGLGLVVGGGVWWSARSKNARWAAQTGQPVV